MMRDRRFIEDLKILVEIAIDLNDKLYERAMKRRYSKRHLEREGNYVDHRIYNHRIETSRNPQFCSFLRTSLRFWSFSLFRSLRFLRRETSIFLASHSYCDPYSRRSQLPLLNLNEMFWFVEIKICRLRCWLLLSLRMFFLTSFYLRRPESPKLRCSHNRS